MPRTFSLARMMLYITLIGVVCGLVVNFPDSATHILFGACLVTPLAFIWLGLNAQYRLEMIKFAASFLGSMAGMRLMIYVIQTWHLRFDYDSRSLAGWFAIAAIITTCTLVPLGVVLVVENYWKRYRSKTAGN